MRITPRWPPSPSAQSQKENINASRYYRQHPGPASHPRPEGDNARFRPVTRFVTAHSQLEGAGLPIHGPFPAGLEERPIKADQLVVFGPGDSIGLKAETRQDSCSPQFEVLLLGGTPLHEPVVFYGPFVSTEAEIAQAISDYQAGRMGTIPASYLNKAQR